MVYRPGLVDALSGLISDHGGSWERSQMSRLGGKFAGIVQIVVPDAQVDELQDALSALEADGALHVTVSGAGVEPEGGRRHYAVSLVGTDQPGLVHAISSALAAAGASIEELDTEITEAPAAALASATSRSTDFAVTTIDGGTAGLGKAWSRRATPRVTCR